MTPEDAMKSKFAADMPEDDRPIFKLLLDAVQATETRRCAARAKETISAAHDEHLGTLVANDLLRTGGVSPDDTDS